jgi:UDP-N-acetyl-D-mannosaminuronic acid transferase (WecB/TagA/CpsF family)
MWFIGSGASLTIAAGDVRRAPQSIGLEWFYRLLQGPRRLFRRCIVHDVPFTFRLTGSSARYRQSNDRGAAFVTGRVDSAPSRDREVDNV